jgi:hypothetical protein
MLNERGDVLIFNKGCAQWLQLDGFSTHFELGQILHFLISVEKIHVSVKSDKDNWHFSSSCV